MFLGHFGIALAGKKFAPRTSLGTSILAAQWLDLLWPPFLLLGWEKVRIHAGVTRMTPLDFVSYPFTHSLALVIAWGALLGGIYSRVTRYAQGALWVMLAVWSHWFLDLLVHRPDLPLFPYGGPKLGLGLWNSPVATFALEGVLFLGGLAIYVSRTRARDRVGTASLWGMVAFLILVFAASSAGPPPPSARAVAWAGLSLWLLPVWGAWIDRHRSVTLIKEKLIKLALRFFAAC